VPVRDVALKADRNLEIRIGSLNCLVSFVRQGDIGAELGRVCAQEIDLSSESKYVGSYCRELERAVV